MDASLTAGAPAIGALSPDAIFGQATALAEAADWAGLQALLADTPDSLIQPRAWPLLVKVARQVPDASAIERAVALATRPGLPPSPRVILIMRLMEDRSPASSAAAWRVFSADPGLIETKSAANTLRCLARLHLRLPEGPSREMAGEILARFRDRFPDADELAGIELRERLLLLAGEEDWGSICRLATEAPDRHMQGDTALDLLTAALHLGRHSEAQRALALMEQDLVRPQRRIWIARRLAVAGMVQEAWTLLEGPDLLIAGAEIQMPMLDVLRLLLERAGRDFKPQIHALIARLLAPPLPHSRKLAFPSTAGFHAPSPLPARLFAAPDVSAEQMAVFAGLLERDRRRVGRPEAQGGIRRPELLVYEDVTVNNSGRVWDAAGRVAPVLHGSTLRTLPPVAEDAPAFAEAAVATDIPRNFFHWFAEGFPALAWRLHPTAPQLPVLINEAVAPLIRETLALMDDSLPLVPVREPVRVGRAFVTRRGFNPLFHWDCYGGLYDRLVQGALRKAGPVETGPKLYLSRRDVVRRGLSNEEAVEEALAALGFSVVTFQGRPLAEQIRMFQDASIVVSPHGAGLAHLAAAKPGLKVFEFMPVAAGTEALRCCYMRLSAIRGHQHALWLETVHRSTRHWRVQLDSMLPALRRFMEETPPR